MITVEEAIKIVDTNTVPSDKKEGLSLANVIGFMLAEDVISPIDMPPFRQSAMDGYAIRIHKSKHYDIIGELQAGDGRDFSLRSGEAVRIFTGAPVPSDANAVVIQEKVKRRARKLELQEEAAQKSNIRPLGEQIKRGDVALKKGSSLNPAAIGFLASLGITQVTVYKKPSIGIIATGNELAEAGNQLEHGQIYESNSVMLCKALEKAGYLNNEIFKTPDSFDSTLDLLKGVLASKDVVIITGGISVGDYDFIGKALQELQVAQLFYKVKQKPGKPIYFGKLQDTYVFALPGNPAAALCCFYIYVQRCLKRVAGSSVIEPITIEAVSISEHSIKGDRAQFLKAHYHNGKVKILEGQSSSMLHTFAAANALLYLPISAGDIRIGDTVQLILLT